MRKYFICEFCFCILDWNKSLLNALCCSVWSSCKNMMPQGWMFTLIIFKPSTISIFFFSPCCNFLCSSRTNAEDSDLLGARNRQAFVNDFSLPLTLSTSGCSPLATSDFSLISSSPPHLSFTHFPALFCNFYHPFCFNTLLLSARPPSLPRSIFELLWLLRVPLPWPAGRVS